jgi:tetratricopeptide (TPR) repeat protein
MSGGDARVAPRLRRSSRAALAILALFCALVLTAGGTRESETIDEALFIAGGAVQVRHLDPNVDFSHPPLLRWVAGIPAVVLGGARVLEPAPIVPRGAVDLYAYKGSDVFDYSVPFFYDSGNSHDRVLFWGRAPFALLGALLGWLVFAAARRLFGPWPALLALLAYAFTPEILAHAQWAHSDLASALTLFLVAITLAGALERSTPRSYLLLGASMGLATATKLTALLLWPPILVLLVLFRRESWSALARKTAVAIAVTYATIVISYLPKPRLLGPHEFLAGDLEQMRISNLAPILRVVPLPDSFLKGVFYTQLTGQRGQIAFFHGQTSTRGWWYYFPAAIFLKYPTGLLVLALSGLAVFWRSRQPLAVKLAGTVPPAVILLAAMGQTINIGVRSVLPIAPFLALWVAAAFAGLKRRAWRGVSAALLATSIASGVFAYPEFLAYFNPLLGGTKAADKWLIDSNLDWGQGLPALAKEMRKRGISAVHLSFFGGGRPSHWGIRTLDPDVVVPGWYAISRSNLSGCWFPGDPYAWLRRMKPVALPSGSIALFRVKEEDLEGNVDLLMKNGLAALYERKAPDAAAEDFRLVLRANPGHYGATFQLARALDKAGRPEEARPVWVRMLFLAESAKDTDTLRLVNDRIARADVVDEDTLMRLGLDELYRQHLPASAVERFREVLRRNPGHYGALFQIASALDQAGRRDEAYPYWEKVLATARQYRDDGTARAASDRLNSRP